MTGFDVAVIGGGPAGCAAAITACRAGLKTILFASGYPNRDRPPESIEPDCLSRIEALGVDFQSVLAWFPGIVTVHGLRAFAADGAGRRLGAHLDRHEFDISLVEAAHRAGAKVEVGRIATPHGLPAKRLILATGRSRHLACQLGISFRRLSPHLAVSAGLCDCRLPAGSPAFFQASEGSWRWLAPLGGGRASWARLAPAASWKGQRRLVTWMAARPAAGHSWTAVGDAALTLDPSWGRGILFALESGVAAAELAARCIRHPQLAAFFEAQYDDWLDRTAEAQAQALRGLTGLGRPF